MIFFSPPPLYHLLVLQAQRLYTARSLRTGAATAAATACPVSALKAVGHWSSAASERYLRPEAQDILIDENAMSHLQDYYCYYYCKSISNCCWARFINFT